VWALTTNCSRRVMTKAGDWWLYECSTVLSGWRISCLVN
jgi:hypothetical protein